jgi:ferredoxin-type protein NapH
MANKYWESVRVMLGGEPRRQPPSAYSEEAKTIHFYKKSEKQDFAALKLEALAHQKKGIWLKRRWIALLAINLLFVVSYRFDIQILEGALTASRLLGFHMIDLNSALQVMLAHKHILVNLLIGTGTVFVLWLLLGGRTFCSWVCPYHFLAENAERLHLYLVKKKWATDHTFLRGVRTVFWLLFAVMATVTGYTVFETISPTGIVSRALIYGPGLAMGWVLLLLLFEIFYSRRAWCRYVCPIGLTYGIVGVFSPLHVTYKLANCHHEGECRKVCEVPHVLECVIKGRAAEAQLDIGADCTRCGMCIDVCPSGALAFEIKGLRKIM